MGEFNMDARRRELREIIATHLHYFGEHNIAWVHLSPSQKDIWLKRADKLLAEVAPLVEIVDKTAELPEMDGSDWDDYGTGYWNGQKAYREKLVGFRLTYPVEGDK